MRIVIDLHVSKRDIRDETVRRIVENALQQFIEGNGPNQKIQYIEIESVKLA